MCVSAVFGLRPGHAIALYHTSLNTQTVFLIPTKALHLLWLSAKYNDVYKFEWVDGLCPGSGFTDELPFSGEIVVVYEPACDFSIRTPSLLPRTEHSDMPSCVTATVVNTEPVSIDVKVELCHST